MARFRHRVGTYVFRRVRASTVPAVCRQKRGFVVCVTTISLSDAEGGPVTAVAPRYGNFKQSEREKDAYPNGEKIVKRECEGGGEAI